MQLRMMRLCDRMMGHRCRVMSLRDRLMRLRELLLRLGVYRSSRGQDLVLLGLEGGEHGLVLGGLDRFTLNVRDTLSHQLKLMLHFL